MQSHIIVNRTTDEVADFFEEPSNLAKWDRSVAKVEVTTPGPIRVGGTFDTYSPSGMKMSYRLIEYERAARYKIILTESKMFKYACWDTMLSAVPEGTLITMSIDLKMKLLYLFLIPVLYLNRGAILNDMGYLKKALENNKNK